MYSNLNTNECGPSIVTVTLCARVVPPPTSYQEFKAMCTFDSC